MEGEHIGKMLQLFPEYKITSFRAMVKAYEGKRMWFRGKLYNPARLWLHSKKRNQVGDVNEWDIKAGRLPGIYVDRYRYDA